MDSRNELYEWEANLRNELRGLNFCKDKVTYQEHKHRVHDTYTCEYCDMKILGN